MLMWFSFISLHYVSEFKSPRVIEAFASSSTAIDIKWEISDNISCGIYLTCRPCQTGNVEKVEHFFDSNITEARIDNLEKNRLYYVSMGSVAGNMKSQSNPESEIFVRTSKYYYYYRQ